MEVSKRPANAWQRQKCNLREANDLHLNFASCRNTRIIYTSSIIIKRDIYDTNLIVNWINQYYTYLCVLLSLNLKYFYQLIYHRYMFLPSTPPHTYGIFFKFVWCTIFYFYSIYSWYTLYTTPKTACKRKTIPSSAAMQTKTLNPLYSKLKFQYGSQIC